MMAFYDIYSKHYLGVFFVFAIIETLLCSGITYGWASIVVVFKLEHFYLRLCRPFYKKYNITFPEDVSAQSYNRSFMVDGYEFGSTYHGNKLPGCPTQDSIFNLIFTVSIFCLSGIKFPTGVFIDRCGPRTARVVGGCLYIAAALGLGFVKIGYEDFLFPVFICICMGGSLLVISVYQVCNVIYRTSKSQVICILHGGFDSSAVLLLIFKVLYEHHMDFRTISLIYSCVCFVVILCGTTILIPPKDALFHWIDEEKILGIDNLQESIAGPDFAVRSLSLYDTSIKSSKYSAIVSNPTCLRSGSINEKLLKSTNEDSNPEFNLQDVETTSQHSDRDSIKGLINDGDDTSGKPMSRAQSCGEHTPLLKSAGKSFVSRKEESVLGSIISSLYLLELVFLATFQLKLWYFVGSLPDYLGRITLNNKEMVSHYISIFGYIQFGGICVTPIIGVIFDRDRFFASGKKPAIPLTPAERRLKKLKQCILPFVITNILMLAFAAIALVEDLRFQIPSYVLYTTVRGFVYANHGSYMAVAFPANQFGTLYGLGIFIAGCMGLFEYALFELTSGPFNGEPFYTNLILLLLVCTANLHPINLWLYCRKETKRLHPTLSS